MAHLEIAFISSLRMRLQQKCVLWGREPISLSVYCPYPTQRPSLIQPTLWLDTFPCASARHQIKVPGEIVTQDIEDHGCRHGWVSFSHNGLKTQSKGQTEKMEKKVKIVFWNNYIARNLSVFLHVCYLHISSTVHLIYFARTSMFTIVWQHHQFLQDTSLIGWWCLAWKVPM